LQNYPGDIATVRLKVLPGNVGKTLLTRVLVALENQDHVASVLATGGPEPQGEAKLKGHIEPRKSIH
jgi:hypothetical protein